MRLFAVIPLACTLSCSTGDARSPEPQGKPARVSRSRSMAAIAADSTRANIYAHAGRGMVAAGPSRDRPLVYVPNSRSASVSVIDPSTYTVLRTFPTGAVPQHIVPSYDLSRMYALNNEASTVTPIDPRTGREAPPLHVDDPYNMYFTPDGAHAIVVAERRQRLDFRDPQSLKLVKSLPTRCKGIDHMEFTADNRFVIATCEFSGHLVKIDLQKQSVAGYLELEPNVDRAMAMPQDIRSSPDGSVFYVADMHADGVHLIDPVAFRKVGFIPTGIGAHGLNPSRDGRYLYVTNRGSHTTAGKPHGPGSISVVDPVARKVVQTWPIPGGGSPDMGNVTADGNEYWVSGRYDSEVYVFDTNTGDLAHRIPVGREPHGLCVWPQPGRYSLGHTGTMR